MNDICILATGGTIDKDHDPITEKLVFTGQSHISDILRECRVKDVPYQILMQKDSLDITDQDREAMKHAILARTEEAIVLTHGTSTMAQTAEYLNGAVPGKTVVLTGAMRPFALLRSDASFNLGGAIVAAQTLPPGVYVAMNGRVFDAAQVRKNIQTGVFEERNNEA